MENKFLRIIVLLLSFRFFVDGFELCCILPTLETYVRKHFHLDNYYVGVVLGAYGIGGMLSGVVLGQFADKKGRGDPFIIAGTILSAAGNLIYSLGGSIWWLVLGRFLAGINTDAIVIGEIGKLNFLTQEQRTRSIGMTFLFRTIGTMVGPLVIVFLDGIDRGHYTLNFGT